jgi:hypothetical protein
MLCERQMQRFTAAHLGEHELRSLKAPSYAAAAGLQAV